MHSFSFFFNPLFADGTYTSQDFIGIVDLKNSRNEIVFDRLWYPLSILCLAAIGIGAKLIGPHGGLQVDKKVVTVVTGSVE